MSTQAIAGSASRDKALDATKGIAILAVVIFHMTRGFTDSGQIPPNLPLKLADAIAYGFHIQTFFLISGYLAWPKAGSLHVQIGRQTSLYYAYLLWSLVSWSIAAAINNVVNHPVSFRQLLFIPIVPIQHFWFLLPLMLGTALLGILRTPFMLACCCTVFVVAMSVPGLPDMGIYSWVFYMIFGGLLRALDMRPKANIAAGILGAAILCAGAWTSVYGAPGAHIAPLACLVTLSGCYAAYVAGSYSAHAKLLGPALSLFGRYSMPIYLLHVIAGSGLRIILNRIAPGLEVYLAVAFTVLAGICVPLLVEATAERLGLATLLGFKPFRLNWTRTTSTASAPR